MDDLNFTENSDLYNYSSTVSVPLNTGGKAAESMDYNYTLFRRRNRYISVWNMTAPEALIIGCFFMTWVLCVMLLIRKYFCIGRWVRISLIWEVCHERSLWFLGFDSVNFVLELQSVWKFIWLLSQSIYGISDMIPMKNSSWFFYLSYVINIFGRNLCTLRCKRSVVDFTNFYYDTT